LRGHAIAATTFFVAARSGIRLESQIVRPALALARERGLDVGDLVRRHGLPSDAADARQISVPLDALRALLLDLGQALDEPHLGLVLAARAEPGTWDLLEYTCHAAPNIREAMRRLARYVRLANDRVDVRFQEGGDGLPPGWASIAQSLPGSADAVAPAANELFVAVILRKCRELSHCRLVPRRVLLAHSAPPSRQRLSAELGTDDIRFDQARNALVVDETFLGTPLTTHDAPLSAILERYASRELEGAQGRPIFVMTVRDRIRERLPEGRPTLESVARALGLTARTLQRRLADEGTSFGAELEGVREDLARLYVADDRRTLCEVAYLLGYSDLSTFVRAFRRWTQMTPARFRLTRSDTRK
jgi:AraC-like DNA-binding protein